MTFSAILEARNKTGFGLFLIGERFMYFEYGAKEITYLSKKDARLKEVIERIGMIYREVDDDLFVSVIHHIVGQQISSKAQATVWQRLNVLLGEINYQNILAIDDEKYREIGINGRKLSYIKEFADKVKDQSFDIWSLKDKSDEEVIKELTSLKGIGVWTAEMILLFCLKRPDVLSYDDLGILRGLRILYHHRRITPELFARYKRRYHPYGSVASLYLWALAGGALPDMQDPLIKRKIKK